MHLVFLTGPPGVGKLTVARPLAEATGYALFHNHLTVDLLTSIFDFGSEPFVRLREPIWLGVFEEAARTGRSLIFTFAPERTVQPGFPARAVEVVERHGGRVVFVVLTCPEEELERRIEAPGRKDFGKLGSGELYRELRDGGVLTYEGMPEPDLVVDTGSLAPERAAALIAETLGLG